MPEIDVATDPVLVYGMVALFVGAVVLALVFSRPRRGLGAVKPSDASRTTLSGEPWMPGGDIFGRDPEAAPEPPAASDAWPAADPWQSAPPAYGGQPAAHDPWSSGASDETAPQPRWDKP